MWIFQFDSLMHLKTCFWAITDGCYTDVVVTVGVEQKFMMNYYFLRLDAEIIDYMHRCERFLYNNVLVGELR